MAIMPFSLGFEEVPERKLTKGQRGHLAKAGVRNLRRLREFRYAAAPALSVGDRREGGRLPGG